MSKSLMHTPVLLGEVKELLHPAPGESVLDLTVGLGSHAEMLLTATSPEGTLIGLDADEENLENARKQLRPFGERATLIHANFRLLSELELLRSPHAAQRAADASRRPVPVCHTEEAPFHGAVSKCRGWAPPSFALPELRKGRQHDTGGFDIIFADLGLSSPHLDDPERGFTFSTDAPLDMRYDRSTGRTAADLLNRSSEINLREIFEEYGEIHRAAGLAKAIVSARRVQGFERSSDLVSVAEAVFGRRTGELLPQVFQALRIAVNDELRALTSLLETGPAHLRPGGRMGIISYHSLEDRLVKEAFRSLTTATRDPVRGTPLSPPPFSSLTRKPMRTTEEERTRNPRSRSARFRAIVRSPAPTPLP